MRLRASFATSLLLGIAALVGAAPARAADPTVQECLAVTETSLKLRTDHHLRQARAQLAVCSSATCPRSVREECTHRIVEVNAALPTVVFAVKTQAGEELAAVRVTMDGELVADKLDGTALSLDPGSHEFRFEVAGKPAVTVTLILHEGEKNRRESIVVGAPEPMPPPAPVVPPAAASASVAVAPPAEGAGRTRRIAGIALGSAGLGGVVVGGIFGALTFSAWSAANSACSSHRNCSAQALSDGSNASTYGTVSDIGFIAGGILLAGGVTLFLTAPKDARPAAALRVVPGGLGVVGSFE